MADMIEAEIMYTCLNGYVLQFQVTVCMCCLVSTLVVYMLISGFNNVNSIINLCRSQSWHPHQMKNEMLLYSSCS